jgi:hypothetical protein
MLLVFLLEDACGDKVTTFCHLTKAYHQEIPRNCGRSLDAHHIATLYRAGMTNVVLHCLFIQQNQRV